MQQIFCKLNLYLTDNMYCENILNIFERTILIKAVELRQLQDRFSDEKICISRRVRMGWDGPLACTNIMGFVIAIFFISKFS